MPQRPGQAGTAAADALIEVWPQVERDTVRVQTLCANTTALRHHTADHLLIPRVHTVLFTAANGLGNSRLLTAAVTAAEQLLDGCLRLLGPDHPDTRTARHNVTNRRGEIGDPADAATALEQVLSDRLRVLGPDHPDTLSTRHSLAW